MGKKKTKKKQRKKKATKSTKKKAPRRRAERVEEKGPYLGRCITGFLPGGMFIRAPEPDGLPIRDTLLGNHVRGLEDSSKLAGLLEDERQLVLSSLSATVLRADYHLRRFRNIRAELDKRRELAPGDVFWDGLGRFLHFELQAFTAAARAALDELVYLIARIHGATSKKARGKPWATNDLFTKDLPTACDVPEVHLLRKYADWYDWLNAYRNASFHHGWVSGTGHFSIDSTDKAASLPSMNALLLPDRDSLRGRGKPFEWTWSEGNNVDDLVRRLETGFGDLLRDMFENAWGVPTPAAGLMPEEVRPTMLVTLPRPVYATIGKEILIPLFTTEETANAFMRGRDPGNGELHRVPVVQMDANVRRVYFSTSRIEEMVSPETQFLHVVVDPSPSLSADGKLSATGHITIAISEVLADEMRSVSMEVERDDVFMWRTPMVRTDF